MTDLLAASRTVRDIAAPWPIVGRDEQLERLPEVVVASAARTVVIGGVAGVGKSRLLAETSARLGEAAVVLRVTATRSASSIPFGALAPILPVDDLLADSIVGVLQRAARAIAGVGRGRTVVVAIDDAHLLDDASSTLIHQLALDGVARLLLAIRRGEHLGPSLAGVVNDPSTVTVDLQELQRRDVHAITRHVLGGEVDGAVTQALWDGSRGNALYLREMLVASIEDGSIHDDGGVWRLASRPTVPARLVELVESRLATVGDDGRAALDLLAVAGSLGRLSLEDVVGTDVVSSLVQRGLVVVTRDGRRQIARIHHPLYEEAVRRRMTSRRLRLTQVQLADLVEQAGMRRRADRLLVTTLRLDAGAALDPAVIEAATLDAYFALDIGLTERLARAGVTAGAGVRVRRLLAEVMRWQGRHDEAEAIAAAVSLTDVDERERTMMAVARAENLFRGLGQREAAERVVDEVLPTLCDPAWRDELHAIKSVFAALSGEVRKAHDTASTIIARGPSRALAIAATADVAALTFMGRPDDATLVAEHAFGVASTLGPQENQAIIATHIMERVLGLVESGRLDEAEMLARMSYEWSLAGGHAIGQGWFSLLLGRSAQTGGRLEEAARRFRESALVFRDLRDNGIRRWALAGLAQASATLGRAGDASMALDELDTAPPTAVHLLEAEVIRARAWLALARRSMHDGRRLLLESAAWARSRGQHALELTALHDLVRLGDTDAARQVGSIGVELQGVLSHARVAHAAALAGGRGDDLDAAAEGFAAIGANLFAAEAAAQAAAAHRRAGRASAASASEARSDDLAARCDGASTPALSAGADLARLTPRELELATLAAAGSSSAQIGEQLGISVRTVNNLLQRAYVKLGISGRHELASRLEQN